MSARTVFILGAGFSDNAGLPLQKDFTKELLKARDFKSGPSRALVQQLDDFVEKVFGWRSTTPLELYPKLEDIFTSIDLSANFGHHLGPQFAPQELRQVRRILISRTIRMLHSAYLAGKKEDGPKRQLLLDFFRKIDPMRHGFVSLNWDGVLEGCLEELKLPLTPQYSPEIESCEVNQRENKLSTLVNIKSKNAPLLISKMHGSINWLYCDCCRRCFSVPISSVNALANQILKLKEAKTLHGSEDRISCPKCKVDLSVRLATFSYQKALRAPMFESSWLQAEKSLRGANKWVFMGYSLPEADFEFKYLLKRVELARPRPPKILVVTANGRVGDKDSSTVISYKKFFGDRDIEFFYDGLSSRVVSKITS